MNETQQNIPGPKVILLGDSGTGKTHVLRTLLDAGITPFIIFTEPGMETLGDVLDQCHYNYIKPHSGDWKALIDMTKHVQLLDMEGIAKIKDVNRSKYTGLMQVINQCNNFIDQHGESFGDVMTWGTDRALCIDSLSGLNDMASQLVVGGKPLKSMGDWQIAQNMLKSLLDKLTTGCQCSVILTAHIAREHNEVTGGTQLMVNTLGKALAPNLPAYFSDVIQTQRIGTEFYWDTSGSNISVKGRNVPIASKQKASFVPLFESWKKKGGEIVSSPKVERS